MTQGGLLQGLRLAFTFPTAPQPSGPTTTTRIAVLVTPLVGAVLAGLAGVIMLVARYAYAGPSVYIGVVRVEYLEAPILAAALALVTIVLLTGGRQLSGVVRTVDQLSGSPGQHGADALGVAALVCVVVLEVLALGSSVLAHHGTQSLVFAVLTGRLAMVWGCTPYRATATIADPDSWFRRTVSVPQAAGWTVLICGGAAVYGRFDTEVGSPAGAVRGVVAVLVATAVSGLLRRAVIRRNGGVSAATLGGLYELAALVSLLVTAAGRP
jgi:adenosylcobinamide-GDP ribazoletransferase